MKTLRFLSFVGALALFTSPTLIAQELPEGAVKGLPCPNGGVQPKIAQSKEGVVHLMYFQGAPAAGDLWYVKSSDEGATFSEPLRVNDVPGSVDGGGAGLRGGEIVLAKDGSVYSAWMGSAGTVAGEDPAARPVLFARLVPGTDGFEAAQTLSGACTSVDVSPSLAISRKRVFVYWHAPGEAPEEGKSPDTTRRVYCASSRDGGKSFSAPEAINAMKYGVSPGCGIRAQVAKNGRISVMYRDHRAPNRDFRILSSEDGGETYQTFLADQLRSKRNPLTDISSVLSARGSMFVWGNMGSVWWTRLDKGTGKIVPPIWPRRKDVWRGRPSIVATPRAVLIAWCEGDERGKTTRIGWQGFDILDRFPIGLGLIPDVSPNTTPALFLRASDRGFTIVY